MDDQGQNTDPLENFFKTRTGDFDIRYNEQDWKELKKRLDFADEKMAYRRRMRWLAAAAVLLFSLLGYFTYENYTAISRLSEQLAGETTQTTEQEPVDKKRTGQAEIPKEQQQEVNDTNADDPQDSGISSSARTSELAAAGSADNAEQQYGRESSGISFPEQITEVQYISETPCPECTFVSAEINDQSSVYSERNAFSDTTGNMIAEAAGFKTYSGENENVKIGRKKSPDITAGLVLGPDLSTAGSISNFQNPGYKIGFNVEVNLGSRLAVSTGIIHSNVRYVARGGEYSPSVEYWNKGIVAQETFAKCALLDIPISLKYDFLQFERSRLFATAGVSSYIMLSEDYRFRYNRNDSDLAQKWSGNTGTGHWFSNAGFSLGYELDVLSAWSLRVEPFVKLPISEVGWGNVKLYSVGSFVSLHYQL